MAAFGTVFMPEMAISWFDGSSWSTPELVASDSLQLHPGAHVLHYSSTCFEGLKAFRHADGSVKIFRMDKNLDRFEQSSHLLALPPIDKNATREMIIDTVRRFAADVPEAPGPCTFDQLTLVLKRLSVKQQRPLSPLVSTSSFHL